MYLAHTAHYIATVSMCAYNVSSPSTSSPRVGPLGTLVTDETLKVTSIFAARQVISLEVKFPPLWERLFPTKGVGTI